MLEENSHGGSQQSLNSTNTVSSASDNPEQIIVQKQRKELVEEGIKRLGYYIRNTSGGIRFTS